MKTFITLLSLLSLLPLNAGEKHLFLLAGQSNMAGMNEKLSFIPSVEKAFGKENFIVLKVAAGGVPISDWYKDWKSASGEVPKVGTGGLYNNLMSQVKKAAKKDSFKTVSYIWMQGERDAKRDGEVYEKSLRGLFNQLSKDMGRKDINFVIGKLSDYDLENKDKYHWTMVREAQVNVAKDYPRTILVKTDDLNDGLNERGKTIKNDLHYSVEGYKTLGKRFAESAISLIKKRK